MTAHDEQTEAIRAAGWLSPEEVAAERRTAAADALDSYADTLGVDATEDHDGDEWWSGYRQAQREHIRTTTSRAAAIRATDTTEETK